MADTVVNEAHDPLELKEPLLVDSIVDEEIIKSEHKSPLQNTNGVTDLPSLPTNHDENEDIASDEDEDGWETESMYEVLLNEESPYIYVPGKFGV